MITLMIGVFIGLFNQTALNMALTNIMSDFQIEASDVQWLTTAYLLVLGILVPVSAVLIQWFTTREIFITSLVFSIIGTTIAGLSLNFEILILARVVQAVGAGLLMPLMTNVILVLYPPERRGTIMGIMVLVIMVAPAIGPTLSGLILDRLGWQGIFWICLPLLVISFAFGFVYMQNVSTITKPKIDIPSIFLSTIGFGGIVFGFSSAGKSIDAWGQPIVFMSIIVGITALVLFSLRQFKLEEPMLDLRVFKFPMFSLGVILVFLCMLQILSVSILLPMYLKGGLFLSAFIAGLLLLPGGVFNGITSLISGRLFDKHGPKYLVIVGFTIVSIMTLLFSRISITTSAAIIVVLHSCTLMGAAMIMNPAQTNGLNQLPKQLYPYGAAVMGTLQQIAGAIGAAIAIGMMVAGRTKNISVMTEPEALTAGIQNAFFFAFMVSIAGLLLALFIKKVENSSQKISKLKERSISS
ncbi:DHA2 family efflux MFS transporter permease subunit [Bacillus sp. FJAT-50079]|uniref:DHA2 family efflux MFS transporter permease subunit n=1 Tax=Bacillus sp. FJAT-50079 TaxID=2833577 RepID=UPI0020169DAE|nr:DHA2 family efflux MFS transporter permease subunit [Bacillus sp. FJAT-50079]